MKYLYTITEEAELAAETGSVPPAEQTEVKDLLGMVQDLSPQYRTVFNLYAIEGYEHKEIGMMLGISEGTSKSNLSRARQILQQKVRENYGLPGTGNNYQG